MSGKWDGWADPMRVQCPKCKAARWVTCRSASGLATGPHADRRWIAEDTKNDDPKPNHDPTERGNWTLDEVFKVAKARFAAEHPPSAGLPAAP